MLYLTLGVLVSLYTILEIECVFDPKTDNLITRIGAYFDSKYPA